MSTHQTTCFVIADGAHARFVTAGEANALHTIEAVDLATAHKRSSDLGPDRPGRTFESSSPTRHGYTPRHDPHNLERHKFGRLVGAMVCDVGTKGNFDALVLVAPADMMKEMIGALDTRTEQKVVGTLEKDLVNVPDHELQPHLSEWVRPPRRSGAAR